MRKKLLALILAGGQGTRLGILTKAIAKPAVPFGGKYRIIDFVLSNCMHSGIYDIGVFTQYKPRVLNKHIGIGDAWDLDRKGSGIVILQPYTAEKAGKWYRGTADAIYQNLDFIEEHSPEHCLILSGDHIYKMNYSYLLEEHIANDADVTVGVVRVPSSEASRFGILSTDSNGKIIDFEEKPAKPKSDLASMGIYMFKTRVLKEVLVEDASMKDSTRDFGKDILPRMIKKEDMKCYAYLFKGFWKDVGTISSYFDTNLSLTSPVPELNLYDKGWQIYTRSLDIFPAYVDSKAYLKNSLVGDGCEIYGFVENCVISQGVYIGEGTTVKHSIIHNFARIDSNCYIERAIIGERSIVSPEVEIGKGKERPNECFPSIYTDGITVIGTDVHIPQGTKIGRNCVVDNDIQEGDFRSTRLVSGSCLMK